MSSFTVDGHVRLSIALALAAVGRGPPVPARWEAEARTLGMCGAEIDAARWGRSFDVRTSRALSLALAAASLDGGCLSQERGQAMMSGIPIEVCREIERLAKDFAGAAS